MGTLPINMECTEKMGVSKEVTSFVLPLGAHHQHGRHRHLPGGVRPVHRQCYGIPLALPQQLTIILTCTLASVGTAGVPGAGAVMLGMVLQSVGLPVEGVALVLGIDRVLDYEGIPLECAMAIGDGGNDIAWWNMCLAGWQWGMPATP